MLGQLACARLCALVVTVRQRSWLALALCEGWWSEPGKRVQVLRVEGAADRTVDTVADIGKNQARAYWFDAHDANADRRIDITIDAASDTGNVTYVASTGPRTGRAIKGNTETGKITLIRRSDETRKK